MPHQVLAYMVGNDTSRSELQAGHASSPGRRSGREMIHIENVSYSYVNPSTLETVHALDGISLDVSSNEFVCILGPSGCGKSTLLTLVAGLKRPSSGRIMADGQEVMRPSADRGMVFQQYALLPWKTVQGNVALGPKFQGHPRQQRNVIASRYIDLVSLTGFENKYPHELSGGMQQRVALARALATHPSVLLMDEPLAAIDAQTRAVLQEELRSICKKSEVACIFVTHNVDEALFLGDTVVIMTDRPGRIHEIVRSEFVESSRNWAALEHDEEFFRLKGHVGDLMRSVVSARKQASVS